MNQQDIFLYVSLLWPSDAIRRHISWSTLVHVIACCLTAPSLCLNQCWLTICIVPWHSTEDSIKKDLKIPIWKIRLKTAVRKSQPAFPGTNELTEPTLTMNVRVGLYSDTPHDSAFPALIAFWIIIECVTPYGWQPSGAINQLTVA